MNPLDRYGWQLWAAIGALMVAAGLVQKFLFPPSPTPPAPSPVPIESVQPTPINPDESQ